MDAISDRLAHWRIAIDEWVEAIEFLTGDLEDMTAELFDDAPVVILLAETKEGTR